MINRRLITVLCFVDFIVLGLLLSIVGPSLPNLAAAVSLPLASAGIIRAVRQIGIVGAMLSGGRLLDRYDGRAILLPGVLLITAGLLISMTTDQLAVMLLASFLLGIGSGFFDVGPNFLVPALYASNASSMLALLHAFIGVGAIGGPLLIAWAVQQGNWRIAYAVTAVIVLIFGVMLFRVRIVTRPADSKPEAPDSPMTKSTAANPFQWSAAQWLALLPLMIVIFAYNGAHTGISDWLFSHAQLVAKADVDTASRVTSLFWVALLGGRLLSIPALKRFGNLAVLAGAIILATLGAALIVLAQAQVSLISVGVVMVSLGFSPVFPIVVAIGGQQYPEARGTVTGILAGAAALGAMIIPPVQGWVGAGQSGGMIVILIASLVMLATITIMGFTRRQPVRSPV